jgi:hypothetical protein
MTGWPAHENVGERDWERWWDRRDFMAMSGGALSALTALAAHSRPAHATPSPLVIVADMRIPASRAFAAEAARSGGRIAWIDGDVTDLWYGELDLRWRSDKVAVAGLTEYGAFFCLERLAMDRGLRTAFKCEHRREGAGWAAQVARVALSARGPHRLALPMQQRGAAGRPPLLISWVLAPKTGLRGVAA